MTTNHLSRVRRATKAVVAAKEALETAIVEAYDAGASLREIAAATNGEVSSPESIRNIIRRRRR